MNIYLIGYRCTGKTSVGKLLAERLGWHFIDADSALVEKYQMTIADMVSSQGWDSFREKEALILKKLSVRNKQVVATGGGVILKDENVDCMKKSGITVWLRATHETIKERMLGDQNTADQRPSLTSKALDDEICETLSSRKALYDGAMNFFVDTDNVLIEAICDTIIGELNNSTLSL